MLFEGGFGVDRVEVDEPGFEECPRHGLPCFARAAVEFDLVVQGDEDVGDGVLFRPFPSAIVTDSRSITFRKFSDVVAQSMKSTRKGRSDSSKASLISATRRRSNGSVVISARSRSEVSRAVQGTDTRDPNARTSRSGTCFCKIRRTVSRSPGLMSIGFTIAPFEFFQQEPQVVQKIIH